MTDNASSDDEIKINLPEHLNNNNTPVASSTFRIMLKIVFWIFLTIIIVIMLGAGYLRFMYNDENIRQLIIAEFNRNNRAKIDISKLTTSLLSQQIQLEGVHIFADDKPELPMVEVKSFNIKLNLPRIIEEKSLYADVLIDGLKLNIRRFKIIDKESNREIYTSNITYSLNKLIELPWKKWLSDIDWRKAGGRLQLSNSGVTVSDDLQYLEDCALSNINFMLMREGENITTELNLTSTTHTNLVGTIHLVSTAILNKPEAYNLNSKLGFLQNITLSAEGRKIDVAQYLEYFGIHQFKADRLALVMQEPYDLNLDIRSNSLDNVKVNAKLKTDSLGSISVENESIGATPKMRADIDGRLNLSQTWTQADPIKVALRLYGREGEIFSANSFINGNFSDEFTATVDAVSNLSLFSKSEIGRKLDSAIYGTVKHSLAVNWKRNGLWKANYLVNGEGVTTTVNGKEVTVPVHGEINCIITKSKLLTPLKGSFDFSFNLPFITLTSTKPLNIDFTTSDKVVTTSIKYQADLEKLYNSFSVLFKSLGIGVIHEIVSGELNADTSGNIDCQFAAYSKLEKYAQRPININASLSRRDDIIYNFKITANEADNLKFDLKGEIKKLPDLWTAAISQSGIFQSGALAELDERFSSVLKKRFMLVPFNGTVREAINTNVNYVSSENYSVASSLKSEVNDFALDLNSVHFARDKLTLAAAFVLKSSPAGRILAFNDLNINTPDSFVRLQTKDYELNNLQLTNITALLSKLPEMSADVSLNSADIKFIGNLADSDLINVFLDQASLSGSFMTENGSLLLIQDLKYRAKPLSVTSNSEFSINPGALAETLIQHRWSDLPKSISDVSAVIAVDPASCAQLFPLEMRGLLAPFKMSAQYTHKNEKLDIEEFSTYSADADTYLVPQLSFRGSMNNFFQNLVQFDLVRFLQSIDGSIDIASADISVAKLKLLAGNDPGSNLRALRGKFLKLNDISIIHKLDSENIAISGSVSGKLSYMSKSSRWPLLEINGRVATGANPLHLKIAGNDLAAQGSLDMSEAAVVFNALAPYRYHKPLNEVLKLEFNVAERTDSSIKVENAKLAGGPLGVDLSGLNFRPIRERFELSIANVQLTGPFAATLENLLLDSAGDRLKADITVQPLDFAQIQQSLNMPFAVNISGTVDGVKLHIDDSYWKYFAPVNTRVTQTRIPNNLATIGSTSIRLSSAKSGNDDVISFGFSSGSADVSIDSIKFNDFTVANPAGFSDIKAIDAREVRIQPDFQTIFSDQIIINRIDIDDLNAYYEVSFTKNNFDVLKNNLTSIFSGNGSAASGSTGRKTLVRDLYVNNGVVRLSSKILMGVASIPVPLSLHLENIGGDDAGQTLVSGLGSIFSSIGKVGLGLVGGVGGVVGDVGKVGKSIITAPFKLFNLGGDKNKQQE